MSVSQKLSSGCRFKSAVTLMPSTCYHSSISTRHSFRSSICPVRSADAHSSPQPRSSLQLGDLHSFSAALLCYVSTVCVSAAPPLPRSALLCCFSCLSLLSAHTGDLLLFLEERIKKRQFDRKCARMKKIKICFPASPISLSLSASLIFCSLPSPSRHILS